MSKKKLSKLLALYLPYVVIGLVATNLGEAWRLAVGKELGDKIVSLMDTLPAAFSNPLPSLHPFDLFIGLCCGAGMRLAVYLKGKNAKKYRHGIEYGSANVVGISAAHKKGYRISWKKYCIYMVPATIIVMTFSTLWLINI